MTKQPTLCAQLQALLDSGAPNLHFEFLPDDLRRVIAALEPKPAAATPAPAGQSDVLRQKIERLKQVAESNIGSASKGAIVHAQTLLDVCEAALAQQPAPSATDPVDLLVAAGFITADKAEEARAIASRFATSAQPEGRDTPQATADLTRQLDEARAEVERLRDLLEFAVETAEEIDAIQAAPQHQGGGK